MKKLLLCGALISVLHQVFPQQIEQQIYAQEIQNEQVRNWNTYRELRDNFKLRGGYEVFLPSEGVNRGDFETLITLDNLLETNPNNFAARHTRATLYETIGDIVKARLDYQHILDNENNTEAKQFRTDAEMYLRESANRTGILTGNLCQIVNGEKQPINNGIVAVLIRNNEWWDLNITKNGDFSFAYESTNNNGIKPGTKRPLVFLLPGKKPVYKFVTFNSDEINLGEIIIETEPLNGLYASGFALVKNNGGRHNPGLVWFDYVPDRTFKLQETPLVLIKTNEEGFYSSEINLEDIRARDPMLQGIHAQILTSENGVVLYNKQIRNGFRD